MGLMLEQEVQKRVRKIIGEQKVPVVKPIGDHWVDAEEFCKLSGLAPRTLTPYVSIGKIERRGDPHTYEYLYTGQKKCMAYGGGRPRVNGERPAENPNSITGDYYTSDERVKNSAWLAQHCLMNDLSFSVELDKIIGEWRVRL